MAARKCDGDALQRSQTPHRFRDPSVQPDADLRPPDRQQVPGPPATPSTSAAVTISSLDGGIAAYTPDSGVTCHLTASGITDPANGSLTFPVLPGRYALTVDPPTPLGTSVTIIDVLDAGQLSIVFGARHTRWRDGISAGHAPRSKLSGSVRGEDVNGQPLLPSGEVEVLSVSDLVPVALQALTDGKFDLLAPPGQYILLRIQPGSDTRYAAYAQPITLDKNLLDQTYRVEEPTLLTGIVEVEEDGGSFPYRPGPTSRILPGDLDSPGSGGDLAGGDPAVTDLAGTLVGGGPSGSGAMTAHVRGVALGLGADLPRRTAPGLTWYTAGRVARGQPPRAPGGPRSGGGAGRTRRSTRFAGWRDRAAECLQPVIPQALGPGSGAFQLAGLPIEGGAQIGQALDAALGR